MLCGTATGGEIILTQADPEAVSSVLPVMREMGCKILTSDHSIYLKGKPRLKGAKTIRTLPYPGFPTDAQALLMALAARADGTTVFVENIFENRFKHAGELCRMGADIKIEGKVAVVQGVKQLYGAFGTRYRFTRRSSYDYRGFSRTGRYNYRRCLSH